jgi:enhancing lycopene biosynthesis protein 2
MARVGVLISGCGFLDGAEIQESVFTLAALSRRGHEVVALAPAMEQRGVVDHRSGNQVEGAVRRVDEEAARIFRHAPLAPADAGPLDALVVPGGFGAALNLCDFALKGPECSVQEDVRSLIRAHVGAGRPLGCWCIAPALVAAALRGEPAVRLTIGRDRDTAGALESMGALHENCAVTGCVADEEHKVVSTPAYMYDARVHEVQEGIEKAVEVLHRWLG